MSILYYFLYYDSQTLFDLGAYAQFRKILAKILSQRQDYILAILKQHVLKQAIRKRQEKLEILSIFYKYKNILENLVDSSDIEYLAISK